MRPRPLSLSALVLTALNPVVGSGAFLHAQDPSPFVACDVSRTPPSETVEERSLYITMRDGVRVAADLFLPQTRSSGSELPTILTHTRYWRGMAGLGPSAASRFWVRHGYAVVVSDARGTGASFGRWLHPWSRDETDDIGNIVDWIVAQPWSNGQVGAIGTSYTGNTAQLAAASNRPAVKAVIPRFMDFDVFTDLLMPGGVPNDYLAREWSAFVGALDRNEARGQPPRGVKPVDVDDDGRLLAAAVGEHTGNPDFYAAFPQLAFRDDRRSGWGASMDDWSTHRYRREIENSGVPIFGWASWLDAGTANGVINRFRTFRNPQRAVIGPWSHGGRHHASPYLPVDTPTDPSPNTQTLQTLCYFGQFLKDRDRGMADNVLIYYTLGERQWKSTTTWPPPETTMQRWFLASGRGLSPTAPTETAGADDYTVDFEATTGTQNRWYTQLGGDVVYPDRAPADERLLTYTSAPLNSDLEITGHPIVSLEVSSTATDGAFIVYLEEVGETGRVTYITEGHLRAIHRKVSTESPPYAMLGPYHSFRREDGEPLVPGEITTLHFALYPTSVLIRRGRRIRLAIAGADKDTFSRIPAEGTPTITVARNRHHLSFVDLPIQPRPGK